MLATAINRQRMPKADEDSPDLPGVLALIAQASAATAQARIELERSRCFIAARGILIAIEDIAGVHVDYVDVVKGEGVLIIARTPITRLDENGHEKTPVTKTYKFFGQPAMRLRSWFKSHEFFSRFGAFDAGDDDGFEIQAQ